MTKPKLTDQYLLVTVAMFLIVAVVVNYSLTSVFNDPEANKSVETADTQKPEAEPEFDIDKTTFTSPLDQIDKRVTKKEFGTYVTPQNSPVSPEKFTGYHTGWDYEILSGELNKDVKVNAFCDGQLVYKKIVNGYGGVAIQQCNIDGVVMTALYGHLRLSSITAKIGEKLSFGETIGSLGDDKSSETDGERKHLHFSLHRGKAVNLRGYVSTQGQLADWIDPDKYL